MNDENKTEDENETEGQIERVLWRGFAFVVLQSLKARANGLTDQIGFTDQIERSWAKGKSLDPRDAVIITQRELYALAKCSLEPEIIPEADEPIHIPHIPINVAEARAMLAMSMLADRGMYAGYTNNELAILPGGAQISVTERSFELRDQALGAAKRRAHLRLVTESEDPSRQ
jgi:hypothetical protein